MNVGLHYEHRGRELAAEARAIGALIEQLRPASRGRSAPSILWRETSPQHFAMSHPFVQSGHPVWWEDEWQVG